MKRVLFVILLLVFLPVFLTTTASSVTQRDVANVQNEHALYNLPDFVLAFAQISHTDNEETRDFTLTRDRNGVLQRADAAGNIIPFGWWYYWCCCEFNTCQHCRSTCSRVGCYVPPIIHDVWMDDATVGEFYLGRIWAIGSRPAWWSIIDGNLPPGLHLDCCMGIIAGTPTTGGTFEFTVQVENHVRSNSIPLSITVTGVPPSIPAQSLPAGEVMVPYNRTLTATGTQPITWSVMPNSLPRGLSLNETTGQISGTPVVAGTFEFAVQARNAAGNSAVRWITITINPLRWCCCDDTCDLCGMTGGCSPMRCWNPPYIPAQDFPFGLVGELYFERVEVSASRPLLWRLVGGDLPSGVYFDAPTGTIIGIPEEAGMFHFTVMAENSFGRYFAQMSITIADTPIITTESLQNATFGLIHTQTLAAIGIRPIVWSVADGSSLPNGLTLNPNGTITGTPTETGTFDFTIQATNTAGSTPKAFRLIVENLDLWDCCCNKCWSCRSQQPEGCYEWCEEPPVIWGSWVPSGIRGVPYNGQLLVSQGSRPLGWSIAWGNLPPGLSLDPVTGVLSGTPRTVGTFAFGIQAGNAFGVDTIALSITIAAPVSPGITTPAGALIDGTIGISYGRRLEATGTIPITWTHTGDLPPGLTLGRTTGNISGRPTTAGTFNFTVQAENVAGRTTRSFSITIVNPVIAPSIPIQVAPRRRINQNYTHQLDATGTAPITWSLAPGALLPPGLSLNANGLISGIPTRSGTFNFTVQASNAGGSATETVEIIIDNVIVFMPNHHQALVNRGTGAVVNYAPDVAAFLDGVSTMVALAPILQGLDGGNATWNAATQSGTLEYNDICVNFTIGQRTFQVTRPGSGTTSGTFSVAPRIVGGRTFVPMGDVFRAFGFNNFYFFYRNGIRGETYAIASTVPLTAANQADWANYARSRWGLVNATHVTIGVETTTIPVGGNTTLPVTVHPANAASRAVDWSSSNTEIASVGSQTGVVTGHHYGQVTITARSVFPNTTSATTRIVVLRAPVITGHTSTHNSATITYTGSNYGVGSYRIEWRRSGTVAWTNTGETWNTTFTTPANLTANTAYDFRVIAVGTNGESHPSNERRVQTQSPPETYIRPVRVAVQSIAGTGRAFGASRTNGRAHAGIDFAPTNQSLRPNVYAVASGVVLHNVYFWAGTHEVAVQKDNGRIVRYAEITSSLRAGNRVEQGQIIGQMVRNTSASPATMLHLEYFMGNRTGNLTQDNPSQTYDHITSRNYRRRQDLLDPTPFFALPNW